MTTFEILPGDELPYRIKIDGLSGAGVDPRGAVCAALSAGHRIPAGMRDGRGIATYLFWNYEPNPYWLELIRALEHNKFPAEEEP